MGTKRSQWIDPKIVAELKIEKGVPVGQSHVRGLWRSKIDQMRHGDSILMPNANYADRFTSALYGYGFASKQKKQFDGKVRVWKIDKAANKNPIRY